MPIFNEDVVIDGGNLTIGDGGRLQIGQTPNSVLPWTDRGVYFTGNSFTFRTYSLDTQVYTNRFTVDSQGHATVTSLAQTSSRDIKENIEAISSEKAHQALRQLMPVSFTLKDDSDKEAHLGFIAEDVPESVATRDGTGVRLMNLVALLTKVVRDQQAAIQYLMQEAASRNATSL